MPQPTSSTQIITTVKDYVKGILLKEMSRSDIFKIGDAVDMLSNENRVVSQNEAKYVRFFNKDGNVVSEVDKYGQRPSSANANIEDRTEVFQSIDMPRPEAITLTVGMLELSRFGLTSPMDLLKNPQAFTLAQLNGMSSVFVEEMFKLAEKIYKKEREQVMVFLRELGSSSDPFVVPFGEQIIAVANARTYFTWGNTSTAALDATEYKKNLNGKLKHTDVYGNPSKGTATRYLLHAFDGMLAEGLLNPNAVENSQYQSYSNIDPRTGLPNAVKMAGVYDAAGDLNDWIDIGQGHKISRVSQKGYEDYKMEVVPIFETNKTAIQLQAYMNTVLVCDSPECIHKAIVS